METKRRRRRRQLEMGVRGMMDVEEEEEEMVEEKFDQLHLFLL